MQQLRTYSPKTIKLEALCKACAEPPEPDNVNPYAPGTHPTAAPTPSTLNPTHAVEGSPKAWPDTNRGFAFGLEPLNPDHQNLD